MSQNIGGQGAQTGDITTGHTVGRDLNAGIRPEIVLSMLEKQIETESKMRILLIDAIQQQYDDLHDQNNKLHNEIVQLRTIMVIVLVAFVVVILIIV